MFLCNTSSSYNALRALFEQGRVANYNVKIEERKECVGQKSNTAGDVDVSSTNQVRSGGVCMKCG
eukprot:scaffold18209_cov88-Skeletonema_dohrnii-CCMP3373.AAC.4